MSNSIPQVSADGQSLEYFIPVTAVQVSRRLRGQHVMSRKATRKARRQSTGLRGFLRSLMGRA